MVLCDAASACWYINVREDDRNYRADFGLCRYARAELGLEGLQDNVMQLKNMLAKGMTKSLEQHIASVQ